MKNVSKIEKILRPRSIAIFGGSRAAHVIRECQKLGYEGDLWPIHPTKSEIEGIKTYGSVEALPHVPDCAYIAVNAAASVEIVRLLSESGCGGAVLHASGFREIGAQGAILQQKLLDAAGDMPIIGPNCYGLLNCLDDVALWPDQHGGQSLDSGVAIITQSGNIAINMTMQKRGVPIAYMFTLGNQAQFHIADAMEAVLNDPRVKAIGLHIEAIDDIQHFEAMAQRAKKRGCPIVAIKTGRSEAATAIAQSHTSSISGTDQLYESFFKRLGIGRVDTVPELLESLKLLYTIGPLKGNNLSSMSCSGGEAGMIADLSQQFDLNFPEITSENGRALKESLGDYASLSNPFDYHTYIWGDENAKAACFSEMMRIGFDANILLLDWPNYAGADLSEWDAALNGWLRAAKETKQKAIVIASLPECMPAYVFDLAIAADVAPLIELDTALKAIEIAYDIGRHYDQDKPAEKIIIAANVTEEARLLDEWKAKKILASHNINIPESSLVTYESEAIAAAEALGYPVVLKAVSDQILHKTELGAVKINLKNADQVEKAAQHLFQLSDKLLVEKMIEEKVAELIIGVKRDAQFGLALIIGSGGIFVELLKDSQALLFPISKDDIAQALSKLKIYPLLVGYRGQEGADIDALIDEILKIADFVLAHQDKIADMDINPLIVGPKGQGSYAVDAVLKIAF